MKKQGLVAAGLMLCSTLAFAGFLQPAPVVVTLNGDGSGQASGDMVSARFAPDDVTFIGCGIRSLDDGVGGFFQSGFCQAGDADGEQFTCFTDNAQLLEQMHATSDFSFITFAWDENGECRSIGFSTQSFYIPDSHAKAKKK